MAEHPADTYTDRNTSDRCIVGFNAGPPITPLAYNQNMQLFQTPDYVVIHTEMVHTSRFVPLDGRPALDDGIRLWTGDSRGYWEGDTLVIESANFNDQRQWIPLTSGGSGVASSESFTLVERFTRIDDDTLEYTFTVTDLDTWAVPWTASMPMQRTEVPLFEYACHEGNYSMEGILSGARADDRAAAEEGSQPVAASSPLRPGGTFAAPPRRLHFDPAARSPRDQPPVSGLRRQDSDRSELANRTRTQPVCYGSCADTWQGSSVTVLGRPA